MFKVQVEGSHQARSVTPDRTSFAGTLSLLEGSLLHCPTVVIQAKNVVISDTSEISTNGTSHMLDTGSLGGASHRFALASSFRFEDNSLSSNEAAICALCYSRGTAGKRGAGGGRIRIQVESEIRLNGTLSAAGVAPDESDDDENAACRRRRLVPSPVRLPLFKRFRRTQRPVPQPSSCAVATLRVDNSYAVNLAGAKLPQPTSLPAFTSPLSLQVNDALVVPADQDATWLLSGLAMLSDQTGSTLKHLGPGPLVLNFSKTNDGLELAFSSILQARELQILGARHITLRQNAAIDANVANLEADEIHAHQGALGQGEGVFKMKANKDLVIKRGSRLQSSQRRCDQLPVRLEGPCDSFLSSADFANRTWLENVSFDILLASRNGGIVVEEEAEIYAGAFLLCSKKNVTVHGLISARGLGCAPNRGDAPGTAPQVQPDGRRGFLTCLHTGGLKYDGWWQSPSGNQPSRVPTWSASGGGGDTAGAGGGIIWIQSEVLEMPSNSTSISASGEEFVFLLKRRIFTAWNFRTLWGEGMVAMVLAVALAAQSLSMPPKSMEALPLRLQEEKAVDA
eukprot:g8806.t1